MAEAQPNILFILSDQQLFNTLGCAGHPMIQTPNLDRLAAEGLFFSDAYCPSPVCGPCRTSLFTGLYPAGHKSLTNQACRDPGAQLLTDYLFQSGYQSGLVGKLHVSPAGARHGFDWRRLCEGPHGVYSWEEVVHNDYLRYLETECYPDHPEEAERVAGESERLGADDPRFWMGWSWVDDQHHFHTWTGREAVRFLDQADASKPFFLNVSFFGPHHPYAACEPWDSMVDPEQVELPPTFATPKESPVFQKTCQARRETMAQWPESWWREAMAKYYGQISQIDREVGRIFQALDERGLWEDTLIVFSSDHGDHMGDYGLLGKGDMYESSVRVPLLIKGPRQEGKGNRIEQPVTNLDLFGTFLDYAGSPAMERHPWIDARSFGDVIRSGGSTAPERTEIYSSIGENPLNNLIMLREGPWKLIRHAGGGGNPLYELYDLRRDNAEDHDLFQDPAVAETADRMRHQLDAWWRDQKERQEQTLSRAYRNGTGFNPGVR